MRPAKTIFAVPTYRLRDVAETVETYDEHFWSNGHSVKMMVFDDSSLANHQKYFSLLEQTKTVNDLYYVGPHEKEQSSASSIANCVTGSWNLWCVICFGQATAGIAISR